MDPHERPVPENRSITDLLGDLIHDMNGLVVTELRLLRAEFAIAGRSAAAGTELMMGGAVLIMVALLVLAQALVIALAVWLGPGIASLVVGGVLMMLGLIFVMRGRARLKATSLTPDKTIEQTRRDVRLMKEQM